MEKIAPRSLVSGEEEAQLSWPATNEAASGPGVVFERGLAVVIVVCREPTGVMVYPEKVGSGQPLIVKDGGLEQFQNPGKLIASGFHWLASMNYT
ncbi:hypothetical protein MCOR23_010087 [Pyricularia oryzae]|uniref:Uncharacterized protein n=1 Tax=Pyricularia grisea TaxID=148305 RepID=A0ABQ8NDW0_PYRGI|nr:hypothetical protein MCOR33_007666 [Pyricularia grisea]KAI6389523.1 hypothetical protein MCOR23_010087 [Pyricularia oryzae]